MKKRTFLLALILVIAFSPVAAVASSATTYNQGDIAVINAIIANNGLEWTLASADRTDVPNDWDGIEWSDSVSNKRIVGLYVNRSELTGALDLSGLTSLEILNCSENHLTLLDLSGLTSLEVLYCASNQLTSLKIGDLASLWELFCPGNQFTSLDLSKNTALERINVNQTGLTQLDVSSNTALEILQTYDNQLTRLDLSKNVALTWVDCGSNYITLLNVGGATALEELYCSNNRLTSLDVSRNASLVELGLENNYFPNKTAIIGLDESKTSVAFDPQGTLTPAPNLYTADEWARLEITSAIAKGFIPNDLQDNYKNTITRQEFCRLAVKYVEYVTGKPIDEVLVDKNLSRDLNAFTDTNDSDILAAFALDITNGTGNNQFTPNGQFSREEAATMLMRTCKVIGMDISDTSDQGFTDIGAASAWARDGINFCRANGIMGGTSSVMLVFSPKGTFTRQESIVTFDRMG